MREACQKSGRGWWYCAVIAGGALWGSLGGCYQPDDTLVNYTAVSATSGGLGLGGEGGGGLTAQEYFETLVKPDLVAFCAGSDCHSSGPRAFLLSGQEYSVITQYKTSWGACLLTDPPDLSPLMTYPPSDEHTGRGWNDLEDVRGRVLTWLGLEAEKGQPTGCSAPVDLLQVGPIEPEGFTQIPLVGLGPEFAGFVMTFYASEIGDPPSLLKLSNISVWPPNERGIRIDDPTFVFLPDVGAPVLDTSFHGDPHTLVAPGAVVLGGGELLTTSWGADHQLAIRFAAVERLFADADGNTFPACTQVELFSEAVDSLPPNPGANQPNGLSYCAGQCHGGDAGTAPTGVMSLEELLVEPRDDELACAKTRGFIVPTQPLASPIVLVTDPQGSASHPFKFGGNDAAHDAFIDAMTPWIDAEGAMP